MQLCVPKIGMPFFDALHAYGVGIFISTLNTSSVTVEDCGIMYEVSDHLGASQYTAKQLGTAVEQALALPRARKLTAALKTLRLSDCRIANLDGLLAASFTMPGTRLVSVADVQRLQKADRKALAKAYDKANKTKERLCNLARRIERNGDWLYSLQREYDPRLPQLPVPFPKSNDEISLPMTIEPAFSFSSRRAISDGLITDKSKVAIRGNRWASLMAFIGAARFLRAQRVAGKLVNLYVPIFATTTLSADTFVVPLPASEQRANYALVAQWLTNMQRSQPDDTVCRALAYQTLRTQGAQQSISVDYGLLDNAQISKVTDDTRTTFLARWENLLSRRGQKPLINLDNLVDWLTRSQPRAWIEHLRDVSFAFHYHPKSKIPTYQFHLVRELTTNMTTDAIPLSTILEREQGTLRFGHALRLLRQHNQSTVRDLIDNLDAAQTEDQVVRTLALAAQECALAGAKTPFMFVPDDNDLKYLLDDVASFGVRRVAGILIILSALRYPHLSTEHADTDVPGKGPVELQGDQ
jgi:hypothetical protein